MLGWGPRLFLTLYLLRSASWVAGGHKGQGLWPWLGAHNVGPCHCLSQRPLQTQPASGVQGPKQLSALGTEHFALQM